MMLCIHPCTCDLPVLQQCRCLCAKSQAALFTSTPGLVHIHSKPASIVQPWNCTLEHKSFTGLCPAAMLPGACRTAEGRKCRLGEGGFGIVYKAVMNGVDEVAVKLVKVRVFAHRLVCHRVAMLCHLVVLSTDSTAESAATCLLNAGKTG